jgi:hypothetical protein
MGTESSLPLFGQNCRLPSTSSATFKLTQLKGCSCIDPIPVSSIASSCTASLLDLSSRYAPHVPSNSLLTSVLGNHTWLRTSGHCMGDTATVIPCLPHDLLRPAFATAVTIRPLPFPGYFEKSQSRRSSGTTRWQIRRHLACRCPYKLCQGVG